MSAAPAGRGRATWLAAGLLLLAFVAGALGGVAAVRLLDVGGSDASYPRRGTGAGRGNVEVPGAIFPAGAQLARHLNLTAEQREQIQAILIADRAKADSILRAVRPVLQARYDSTTEAVRRVLTPEQREQFDRLREDRRARFRRGFPPRGAPRP